MVPLFEEKEITRKVATVQQVKAEVEAGVVVRVQFGAGVEVEALKPAEAAAITVVTVVVNIKVVK